MKKILLVLLVISTTNLAAKNSVKKYFHFVNKAELSVVKNDLKQSSKYYFKAFKQIKSPFCRDIKNAFLCEFYGQRNPENLLNLSKLLRERGLPLQEIIDSISRDSCYYQLLKVQDSTKNLINLVLSSKIDSLFQLDQNSRSKCPGYRDSCKEKVIAIDSSILNSIIQLHHHYGDFREDNIGYKAMQEYLIIILHEQSWKWNNFRNIHLKQALDSEMDSRAFAWLEDRVFQTNKTSQDKSKLNSYYGSLEPIIISNVLFICISTKDKKGFNRNRKKLSLESFDDLEKKTIFQFYTKSDFDLNPDLGKIIFPEDKEYAQKLMMKIDKRELTGKYYILNLK